MSNTLAGTASPYLQQRAGDPVDWQPWGPEALEQAKAQDKPLLISIGYSACFLDHVMARESFEDPAVAALMNEHFVCIKVDREERPDVDAIYRDALQHLTGSGGWPINLFATPDGRPFYAGGYFPTVEGEHKPSWSMLLGGIAEVWSENREGAEEIAAQISGQLSGVADSTSQEIPRASFLEKVHESIRSRFDSVNGGFGATGTKFAHPMTLSLLMRLHSLPMARYTLTTIAASGLQDHVGGGFSRYAIDPAWTVPNFEKLLADNAVLAARYVEAHDATGNPDFGAVAERTLDWVIAELGDADGGFASSIGAGTGDVEGAYYLWTPSELREALGEDDAEEATLWFGVTEEGNAGGGASVLNARGDAPDPETAARILTTLRAARDQRPRPNRDDKRIVSWNALLIEALAASGVSLGRADHLEVAERCADLILSRAVDPRGPGRVLRLIPTADSDSERRVIPAGILDDHAHLLSALVALYEATFAPRWLAEARAVAAAMLTHFSDPDGDGFFSVSADHEPLVARRKDLDDAPLPSGQSSAALGLLRLHGLTNDPTYRDAAEGVLRLTATVAGHYPLALAQTLIALDQFRAEPTEIAIVGEGPDADALVAVAREHADAHAVIAAGPPAGAGAEVPLLAGRELVGGQATAYLCHGFAVAGTATSPAELESLLGG